MNILWSLDGTIFDTYPSLVQSFIELSRKNLDKKEVLKFLKDKPENVFEHFGIQENQRIDFDKLEDANSYEKKPPFPFVEKVFRLANKNLLVTNKNRASTLNLLKKWGLIDYFYEILCLPDDKFQKKPNPSSYEYLHDKYKIDLVIGNREIDLVTARELGIKTCSFQNKELKADFYLNSYQDFCIILLSDYFDVPFNFKNLNVTPELLKKYFDENEDRLYHILEVADKSGDSHESLLHDIGYSIRLQRTQFHPLDGALFCIELGLSSEIILPVMFHTGAFNEIKISNSPYFSIYKQCSLFIDDTMKEKIDWLTYCDLTTSPKGESISVDERIADILERYEPNTFVHKNISIMKPYFKKLEAKYGILPKD